MAMLMPMMSGCGKDGDSDNDNGTSYAPGNSDNKNGLTASALEVGMTYVDLEGVVDLNKLNKTERDFLSGSGLTAGFEFGENPNFMSAYPMTNSGGRFSTTIKDLNPNTTYYYRVYLKAGNIDGGFDYEYDGIKIGGTGKTGTFTTKSVSFNGKLSATMTREPTFYCAYLKCEFNTSSINSKETFRTALAFSQKKNVIEGSDLGRRYPKGGTMKNPSTHDFGTDFGVIHAQMIGGNGYWVGDDAFFADSNTADLSKMVIDLDEPGATFYYCPIVVFGETAFKGEIGTCNMRQLPQTTGFVDLGLSCQWSATNLNASSPWRLGYTTTLLDNNIKDGRLPTDKEVLELNKCKLEIVDNGILVTGLNSKQIFIPYLDDKGYPLNPGYGTSSTQTSGNSKYDVLFVFDSSTKKFKTKKASDAYNYGKYSMHSSAYVRPVMSGGSSSDDKSPSDDHYDDPDYDDVYAILLRNILESPLLAVKMEPNGLIYDKLYAALNNYVIDGGSWGGWGYINVCADNNPNLNILYRGMDFYNLYFSESSTAQSSTYEFRKKVSDLPDPAVMGRNIEKDFNNIGIPIKLDVAKSGGVYPETINVLRITYPYATYGFSWDKTDDGLYWRFYIYICWNRKE